MTKRKKKNNIGEFTVPYAVHLERSSIIFGLTTVANTTNVNTRCYKQLQDIQLGVLHKEPWAMKVLDASGTKPAGFLFGQNFWFGSREACGAVQHPVEITLSKNFPRVMNYGIITERAPFKMSYRVVYLRHHSPWQVEIKLMSEQIIHIGLCLPVACTSVEMKQLTSDYVRRGLFVEDDIYDMKPEVIYMKDLKLNNSFFERKTFKMVGAYLIFTIAMTFVALFMRMKINIQGEFLRKSTQRTIVNDKAVNSIYNENMTSDSTYGILHKVTSFCLCYDLNANYQKMFATGNAVSSDIPVINGLRSVCAIWIMVFHVVWFMYFTVNNKTFLISYAERAFFQYVSSAPLLVDVFFTISGFLHVYNFMRNTKQMIIIRQNRIQQNVVTFLKMLFHRYLRLAPLYLVVIGVVDLFFAYIGEVSIYHINERFDESCSQHWWRNLLFIQNFFDHKDMCLNWTWSLACEMQYYILATILLFIYAKYPKFVKVITIVAFLVTFVWSYFIGLNSKFQLSFDSAFATGTEIYISPFVRIMPYIVGAVVAWYFIEQRDRFNLTETKEMCAWNLAILIFFICIYSTIKRDISYFSSISLFVIGRFLFSASVCWMIVGSAMGRSSWWSHLLEAKLFQHFNRLTYAIYLLNPFVVAIFFSLTSVSTHADPFMLCVMCSGFAVIVYLASIVFSLIFEMPFSNWSSLMLKRKNCKTI